ncbi:MAG: L-arabinose isomerase [Spirochaetia bacterium]
MKAQEKTCEIWFVTGSQHLYGDEVLKQVAADAGEIAGYLDKHIRLPVTIVKKSVLTTPESITRLCLEANSNHDCIGLITWMHTFSPAKMWIAGLKLLSKPFLHLHTQYNRDIPWGSLDMDYMNLHQSAHGGREFGFIASRMRIARKVVVGYWKDAATLAGLDTWLRAAMAWDDSQKLKIARFGDNMREVAVTEGDKVEAQMRFGYSVSGFGVGELAHAIGEADDAEAKRRIDEYRDAYEIEKSVLDEKYESLYQAARIENGLRSFLEQGGFKAFTTTFEDLHGLRQLPGLAVQRLMADGYGFGAEGDWKTAALVRSMKVMARGLPGGTSFMEDYTYHLHPDGQKVLGAHMLEVCPSIASGVPRVEVHPLSIGGKEDPSRLVFDVAPGRGLNATLIDLGNRFRLLVNAIEVEQSPELPKLPVARVLWTPLPGLETAAGAWILAGGAHHTAFSKAVRPEHLEDFAEMAGIELLEIDEQTSISGFKKELRWNEAYYSGFLR